MDGSLDKNPPGKFRAGCGICYFKACRFGFPSRNNRTVPGAKTLLFDIGGGNLYSLQQQTLYSYLYNNKSLAI